ncbi:hypothetical protein D1610_06900 [Sphingomonas gilva]|uniref:DUF5666 domain-containing protein n=1 Tax=Sphingomonas gilva TaxID=2305907 RepID=A0A396RS99_9SPHN|nr:hypothetical protein [Sphingomonas gilva]RHW18202.1 hypothetical protein D1610_06900 [Sphingomonas gilva]
MNGKTKVGIGAAFALVAMTGLTGVDAKKGARSGQDYYAAQFHAPSLNGKVRYLLVNPFGETDGLLLHSGLVVKFPAHMSDQLVDHVRRGESVTVQGRVSHSGQEVKAWSIHNLASGRRLIAEAKPWGDLKPPKHIRYLALTPMIVRGTVAHVLVGKRGEVKTVILDEGVTARLPKHLARPFAAIQPGMTLSLSGRGSTTRVGKGIEVERVTYIEQ